MPQYFEYIAPEYEVPVFTDLFQSPEDFDTYYSGTGQLESEINSAFLQKLWYMLYAKYGNNPIAYDDITQWKYALLFKMNAYAPAFIKKDAIQKSLRALDLADLREGYKSIFNHAINPSQAPSTDSTEELPYISDQNVNKTKKNKADAYATLWDLLRTDVWEQFIIKFNPLFAKVATTTDRVVYIGDH